MVACPPAMPHPPTRGHRQHALCDVGGGIHLGDAPKGVDQARLKLAAGGHRQQLLDGRLPVAVKLGGGGVGVGVGVGGGRAQRHLDKQVGLPSPAAAGWFCHGCHHTQATQAGQGQCRGRRRRRCRRRLQRLQGVVASGTN